MKKLLVAAFVLLSVGTVSAQTADEVVNKHITALGGKEKLAQLKSSYMEANISVQGNEIPLVIQTVNKKGMKVAYTFGGNTGYDILTDKAGWSFNPFMGHTKAEPISEDEVKERAAELDLEGALVNYKEKGNTVELLGKEDVEGVEAYKLKVTYKTGASDTYYIDPATYYIIKSVSKRKIGGQEREVANTYSDYRKTPEGYVFPFSLGSPMGTITVTKVEVNKPMDESVFKPTN